MRGKAEYIEQQLVNKFRIGDQKSFSKLFHQLYPILCFYAVNITDDQGAAEDITEESFIKIWDRRETFSNYKVFRSFLYSTVRNASLNWLKQKNRQVAQQKEIMMQAEITETSVLENIVRAEVFNDVYSAFEKLPPKCRQIISMIFFQGKNTREVAEDLNLSIGTVKTQKARGLMILRNKLTLGLVFLILIL